MLRNSFLLICSFILLSGLMTSVYAVDNTFAGDDQSMALRILPKELKGLLDKGETVLIVDVRSESAYNSGHIAGAISVPLNKVGASLGVLPPETKIVFY